MLRWQNRGDLLRWWREDIAGISQRELADELGVARTAVTNWEQGSRMVSLDFERVDQTLQADGVLAGLLWSFDTPSGMQARHVWSSVYPGASSPVWMWIRCSTPTIAIEAEWGFYRFEGEVAPGENGLLVTLGVSIEQSPVVVQLSSPGWVDFGRGVVPPDVPGAPEVDPVSLVVPSSASGDFSEMLSSDIAKQFAESPTPEVAGLGEEGLKPVESLIGRSRAADRSARQPSGAARVWPSISEGLEVPERARFKALREARGLSLIETSRRLAEVTGTKASKDTLRRFEDDKGDPHDRLLQVALDQVLGGNGHLAVMEIASGHGPGTVKIPHYWTGPVWLAFSAAPGVSSTKKPDDADTRIVDLQWGSWRRRIDGDLPLLVVSHAPLAPLRLATDKSTHWTVGVGRRAGAIPINHRWLPDSIDTTHDALSEYQRTLYGALRHAHEQHREPGEQS
ncbi:MAG: helix-turn-helix transcriptional regulator [Acidimicrobiales bacterium]